MAPLLDMLIFCEMNVVAPVINGHRWVGSAEDRSDQPRKPSCRERSRHRVVGLIVSEETEVAKGLGDSRLISECPVDRQTLLVERPSQCVVALEGSERPRRAVRPRPPVRPAARIVVREELSKDGTTELEVPSDQPEAPQGGGESQALLCAFDPRLNRPERRLQVLVFDSQPIEPLFLLGAPKLGFPFLGEGQKELPVSFLNRFSPAMLLELFLRVLASRRQESITTLSWGVLENHERLLDQRGEKIEDSAQP